MNFTKIEASYLAGFFDGEGTFSVFRRPEKRSLIGYSYQPYVEVASTNKEIIVWLHKKIGKGFTFWRPRKGNAKDAYAMHITGIETIIEFIDCLLPYLRLKRKVALKVREFCFSRDGKMHLPRGKRGFTDKEIRIFQEIRLFNKRGRI